MFKKLLKSLIFNLKSNHGFTLIELLVVVAIIGVLSALLMSNFIGVRQRARDAQRKSDVRQMQSALELYRADNGSYPVTAKFPSCGSSFTNTVNNQTTTYMQKVPCDPSTGSSYTYASSDGTTYAIISCLENGTDNQKDAVNANPPCDGVNSFSFTVNNP